MCAILFRTWKRTANRNSIYSIGIFRQDIQRAYCDTWLNRPHNIEICMHYRFEFNELTSRLYLRGLGWSNEDIRFELASAKGIAMVFDELMFVDWTDIVDYKKPERLVL